MTAETSYCDPSAVRSLYVHDPRSRAMNAWRAHVAGALPITRFAWTELARAASLKTLAP